MAEAGYSGTPLIKKLGITNDMKLLILHAPENYFQLINKDLSKQYATSNQMPDFIHLFAKNSGVFIKEMKTVLKHCKKNTSVIVWISWYKKNQVLQLTYLSKLSVSSLCSIIWSI